MLKSQDRYGGFKKATRLSKHPTKQMQAHPFDNSAASVCSHETTRSILSTATPFCVFYDDDNNTVVSYKIVHQAMNDNDRQNTNQRHSGLRKSPEPSIEICYPHNVEDISKRYEHAPLASSNLYGVAHDLWSSNWNEMNDDDSITSAGTVMNRCVQEPQQEIVFVRSKYSYAQENVSRLSGSTMSQPGISASDNNDNSYPSSFPWDAYKVAISSRAVTKSKKSTKLSSSRSLPHCFDREYVLVEL